MNSRRRVNLIGLGVVATPALLIGAHLVQSVHTGRSEHRTFHLSQHGDDAEDGLSPSTAWRTLDRAEKAVLRPGDRLLLEGGSRFSGRVSIGPGEAGDAAVPVVIDSYGDGRATIEAVGDSAVAVYNTAGVEIRNLVLIGDEVAYDSAGGVRIYSDLPGDRKLDGVVVSDVDVTRFKVGVTLGASSNGTGFRNVTVRNSVLRGNKEAGLLTYGPPLDIAAPRYAHEALTVSGVEVYDTLGDPDNHIRNTGSGIVFGSVDTGLIERSSAHDNGSVADAPEGPVGIWAYDSTSLVVQHNASYHNHTAGRLDGSGFDLDQNVTSSTVQYNLSYGNDGAGYMLYSGNKAGGHSGNTVRFNISSNDGRKLTRYGGISLDGIVSNAQIYHNTVIASANSVANAPAVRVKGVLSGITIRNNIFIADGVGLVASFEYSPAEVTFQGNNYHARSGPWGIGWGRAVHSNLASWRAATGQERVGSRNSGFAVDPQLAGGAELGPEAGRAVVPRVGSAVAGKALDLRGLFGIDPGPADYFGRPLSGAVLGAAQPQPQPR